MGWWGWGMCGVSVCWHAVERMHHALLMLKLWLLWMVHEMWFPWQWWWDVLMVVMRYRYFYWHLAITRWYRVLQTVENYGDIIACSNSLCRSCDRNRLELPENNFLFPLIHRLRIHPLFGWFDASSRRFGLLRLFCGIYKCFNTLC